MSRKLTPASSLEHLKGEAKRWLKALRQGNPEAIERFRLSHPRPPAAPGLRDLHLALAREYGFPGWAALKAELARRAPVPADPDSAVTELLAAASRGDASRVEAVLAAHPDIVNRAARLEGHEGRRTALHHAVGCASEAVVDVLLARGADPNIRDEGDNAFPLHFAAEKGHLQLVRKLLDHGADPEGAGDFHGLGVLGWAVCFDYAHHPQVAELLLARGAPHTVFTAVALGDLAALRRLVAANPGELNRVMDATNRKRRPLHLAIVKRQPAALALLLELGADPEQEDAAGLTPLDLAALRGERPMAEQLRKRGARVRLPAAAGLGLEGELERLVAAEPDALRPGNRWDRLLIRAAELAPGPVVERLIRSGASVHVRDSHETAIDATHGYTALHAAAASGNLEAARVLLRHGASPQDREDKYLATPAGWADWFGHAALRDLILEGPIDLFDAIAFDRAHRIPGILARDPEALERPFRQYVSAVKPGVGQDPDWTPLACAAAAGQGLCVELLLQAGADPRVIDSRGRTPLELARERGHPEVAALLEAPGRSPGTGRDREIILADFLRWACLDWRVGGSWRDRLARDAGRLLETNPWIATASFLSGVVCGELDLVRRRLAERPSEATAIAGPRSWPPLLYLCSARVAVPRAQEAAVAMAALLLDHGADPNSFYLGGNADIHYTALTCLLGRGEELGSMHPRARELAGLLLERGADPHDNQVLYNVFADNTSRHLLDDGIVWLLELMFRHSVRRGHRAAWENPEWPMFDMKGAPSLGHQDRRKSGARFLLEAAVDRNLLGMAGWLLSHGAGPNTGAGTVWKADAELSLYQQALARGHREMAELLLQAGAKPVPLEPDPEDRFIAACLAVDPVEAAGLLARHPGLRLRHRALFTAASRGRSDAVALILDLGIPPDVEDPAHRGQRALHHARTAAVATLLIERGAEVDPVESEHQGTPLSWAAWFGNREALAAIAPHSRDVWTLVATGQVSRLREVLEEEPALARSADPEGNTPLMWLPDDAAAAREAAGLLVRHGADPGVRDARGRSAADLAERRELGEVARFLRDRGG